MHFLKKKFQKIFALIIPFAIMALAAFVFITGIILFSYLLIFVAMVGLVIFAIAYIRYRIFATKTSKAKVTQKSKGRVIEHEEK